MRVAHRGYETRAAAIGAIALLSCLTACIVSVPVKEQTVEADLPARTSPIVAGQTDVAAARALLGAPWLASDYWHFDLFRTVGRDTRAPVMFVFWWPVPMGVEIDKTTVYVLVTYDPDGRVAAFGHGIARDPSIMAEADRSHVGARMDAGEFSFASSDDADEGSLAVGVAGRDRYLQSPVAASACRVVFGCEDGFCRTRVAIDRQSPVDMPATEILLGDVLIPLQVTPGTHHVAVTPNQALLEFEAGGELMCTGGETLYGLIKLKSAEFKLFRHKMDATLVFSREMPPQFVERSLLIWSNDRWLAPPATSDH